MEKHFALTYQGDRKPCAARRLLRDAAALGWENQSVGRAALDALAVGESVNDPDGDTWTREA